MKKYFIIIVVAAVLASCNEKDNGLLDPGAQIYINGREAPRTTKGDIDTKSGQRLWTVGEVVRNADCFQMKYFDFEGNEHQGTGGVINQEFRDTINNRFVLPSDYVIQQGGVILSKENEPGLFMYCHNIMLVTWDNRVGAVDTVAYIPNAVARAAETAILAAYEAENYEECYRLFEEAFVFIPVTGQQYLELIENDTN